MSGKSPLNSATGADLQWHLISVDDDFDFASFGHNVQNEAEGRTASAAESAFACFDRGLDTAGKYWCFGVPGAIRVVYGIVELIICGIFYGAVCGNPEKAQEIRDHFIRKGLTDIGRGIVEIIPGGGALISCLTEEAPLDDQDKFARASIPMDELDPVMYGDMS